jgi:hypothetical protein
VARRNLDQFVGVAAARLYKENLNVGILAQTVSQNAAGRPTSNDHVVEGGSLLG